MQWDRLLGEGAKKKLRCNICTRPIGEDSQCRKLFLCSSCAGSQGFEADYLKTKCNATSQTAKSRSLTPSTNADSDDLECSFNAAPPCAGVQLDRQSELSEPLATQKRKKLLKPKQDMANARLLERLDTVTKAAIREVQEQLVSPGDNGFIWIDAWNERYAWYLGSLRAFLEAHPEEFTVIPLRGKSFRVAAAKKSKLASRRRW
jgi:hypothetical protein